MSKLIYLHLWHYLPCVKKNFIVSARHIDTKSASCYFSFAPSLVTMRASIESNLLPLSPRLINSDWVRVCYMANSFCCQASQNEKNGLLSLNVGLGTGGSVFNSFHLFFFLVLQCYAILANSSCPPPP